MGLGGGGTASTSSDVVWCLRGLLATEGLLDGFLATRGNELVRGRVEDTYVFGSG